MAQIVIIGGGLGGVSAAYEIATEVRGVPGEHRVTLVSDSDHFEFTPSNPWVGVGWRKQKDIVIDLAPAMRRRRVDFVASAAEKLEPAQNTLRLANGTTLTYDQLVIATGPELAFDEIEGLGPGGYTQSVCKTDHATAANRAFEGFCANPGPIVVGAVQGASCFGPAYEYAFMLDTELRKRRIRDRVPITFVSSEPYIGHLGLDGVGDTKGLLESELRHRHIKWIVSAKVERVEPGLMHVAEISEDGAPMRQHEVPFAYAMMLPAFRGVAPLRGVEGLVNPRGFVLVDQFQRNPTYPNIYGVGVCVAIPPIGATPVPVGVPKTGFMIETMAHATALNIRSALQGQPPAARASWNALCLADFGDEGVAFVAMPQIPPRNMNWSAQGQWVHTAKVLFERYFLNKTRRGTTSTFYENFVLKIMGLARLKS